MNTETAKPHDVWNTLERIRSSLDLSTDHWQSILRMTEEEIRLAASGKGPLLENAIIRLSESLDLDPDAVMQGTLDFKALRARGQGVTDFLPERYSVASKSKRRTSAHILDFLEISRGWRARQKALRRFQISEAVFSNLDGQINILFLQDLCDYLISEGFSLRDLYKIGQYSTLTNQGSQLASIYRQLGVPKLAYEVGFTELVQKYYEQNYTYRLLKLEDGKCTVEAVINPEVGEALRSKSYGNSGVCAAKCGTMASITAYISLPCSKVREISCIHNDDPSCMFEIDFTVPEEIRKLRGSSHAETTARAEGSSRFL